MLEKRKLSQILLGTKLMECSKIKSGVSYDKETFESIKSSKDKKKIFKKMSDTSLKLCQDEDYADELNRYHIQSVSGATFHTEDFNSTSVLFATTEDGWVYVLDVVLK